MTTLEIEGLRLRLPGAARPVLAGVHLTVGRGETVALVGESGSGKSLTCRAILGLLPTGAEVQGAVRVQGEDVLTMAPVRLRHLRSHTVSMIFQDPRAGINPVHRVGDFLTESLRTGHNVAGQKVSKADARRRATELLEAVGLAEGTLHRHPHQLSGGMLQRVMIASALMTDPALLLADEPTTALDVTTQAETIALLTDLRHRFGTGLLFVTHDLALAAAIADRVYVMYAGRIVEHGDAQGIFAHPRHPYTSALIAAHPSPDAPPGRLQTVAGRPPDLTTALPGCAFASRCPYATAVCAETSPTPAPVDGHAGLVACHHASGLDLKGGALHDRHDS